MRCLMFILLIIATTAHSEGLYLTVGAGVNDTMTSSSTEWNDGDATGAFIALSYKWDKQNWCKCYPAINWAHLSQWESGAPWNDDSESSIDHVGVSMTWAVFER